MPSFGADVRRREGSQLNYIVSLADADSSLVLDPASAHGTSVTLDNSIVVSVMPARGEVTQLSHVGEWNLDQYEVGFRFGM